MMHWVVAGKPSPCWSRCTIFSPAPPSLCHIHTHRCHTLTHRCHIHTYRCHIHTHRCLIHTHKHHIHTHKCHIHTDWNLNTNLSESQEHPLALFLTFWRHGTNAEFFKIILCCFQFIESVHCANNDAMEVISVGGCLPTIISCACGCEMPSQPFASENPLTADAQQIQFPFISLHLFDFY